MEVPVTITKSKMPGSQYFFYRSAGFDIKRCRVMIVSCESLYDNFSATIRSIPNFDNSVAFLMFMDETEPEKMVSELELFISNTDQEENLKIFMDVASLYRHKGIDECKNILDTLETYLVLKSVQFVFAPPIISPDDMPKVDEITQIQKFANELNVRRHCVPCFPFSWVMRKDKEGKFRHMMSCWDGSQLTQKGSIRYLKAIWKYSQYTFDADLSRDYNLESRVAEVQVSAPEAVNHGPGAANHDVNANQDPAVHGGWGYQDQVEQGEEIGDWTDQVDSVDVARRNQDLRLEISGRINKREIRDLRVKLSEKRIIYELTQMQRLQALPGAQPIPRKFQKLIDEML